MSSENADAEPPASGADSDEREALRQEIQQLREQLVGRTDAWREALRQLSQVQSDIAVVRGRSGSPAKTIEPLSDSDWTRLGGDGEYRSEL
jgi:chromosome segregation ATPase